jgi:hypothetical protein
METGETDTSIKTQDKTGIQRREQEDRRNSGTFLTHITI